MTGAVELRSTLTCPHCGHVAVETMPTDACIWFYDCLGCGVQLKPKPGDCCVFCSYGDVPCPPVQVDGEGCCGYGKSVPKSVEGFVDDLRTVLRAFSAMAAGYCAARVGREEWEWFVADIASRRAISLSPEDVWR